MKTEMILPMSLNVCYDRFLSIGIRITRRASFILAALVYVLVTGTLLADTHYVDATRPNDSGDGLSWATAERTIQAAVTAAAAGDTIIVTNGLYAPISTANKAITIQSVNGAEVTIIDGGGASRCATLGSSSSHTNTILVAFTLRNGYTSYNGGGSYYGTVNNCTLSENSASSGGGSYYGTLSNCTLTGNRATDGGGSHYGTLNNCTLSGNNASSSGGGSYSGTLNNCTLSGNSASSSGGGSYSGTLNNCIVWGNTLALGETSNYYSSTFKYSCTTPLPSGTGNLSSDPVFRLPAAGIFRLSPGSPCLNAGTNGYAVGAVDGYGNPRIQNGTVDMGACEGAWTLETDEPHLARNVSAIGGADGITVSWAPPSVGGSVLYRVCRMDMTTGQWFPISSWVSELTFVDTQVFFNVIYRYAIVSAFDTRLDAISGLSATVEGQRTQPQLYVDASRPNDVGNGRSWATAKKTIQGAIDVSIKFDTILVTNGVYAAISTDNKSITIQSVNGADVTIIDGGGMSRCATMGSASAHVNTMLDGFILRNGSALEGGGSYYGALKNCTIARNSATYFGGGAYYCILSNCILTGNSASNGGGSSYGTLNDCKLIGNSASTGGGAYYGTLNSCTLSGNSASSYGGGVAGGTLNNCTLIGNSASSNGGGGSFATLNRCTLAGNSASTGGGAYSGTLTNCTLMCNRASSGGGSYSGTLNNCTLAGNSAFFDGGGAYFGTLTNCIVWGNRLVSGGTNNYFNSTFGYSCTTPQPFGIGNVGIDPLFRMSVVGDLRLSAGSPCLNSGTNGYEVGTIDLLGNPRIQDGTVDMGACEGAGTMLTDAWCLARTVLATGVVDGISVSWEPPSVGGAVLYWVCRMDIETGVWTPVSGWISELRFLDTQVFFGVTYRYAIVSAFDPWLNSISGLSAPAEGRRIVPQLYVDASRPNDTGDGRGWLTAKKTIQAAIDVSNPYETIMVTNGVYSPISTDNKAIKIESVNGAAVTFIDGGGTNRCATMGNDISDLNTILVGFTLQNGFYSSYYGGGSYGGTLYNCTLTGNRSSTSGGGSYGGVLNNCKLIGNIASSGGGAYYGTLNACTLTGNIASDFGGGTYYGTLNDCTLTGNGASSFGGGSSDSTLNSCTLTGNSATFSGGGSYRCKLINCTLTRNSATSGGGSCYGTLSNCTLTENTSSEGGGVYNGTLTNCIVWGNMHVLGVTNNCSGCTIGYSCTSPLLPGTGNISVDPLFRLPPAGDFRLLPGSPCLNSGTNSCVVGAMDGFGNPRIHEGTVDMGACEGAWTLATDAPRLALNVLATGGTDGITLSWEPPSAGGALLCRVCRMDMETGEWSPVSGWITELSFLDTHVFNGRTYRYAIASAFDARFDVISCLSTPVDGQRLMIPHLYVDSARPDDTGDGRSWATAKRTIQSAIDVSLPYDMIVVTNGVYAPIWSADKAITIQSINGADVTIIDGGGTNRCATLGSIPIHLNTILVGFTLCNGSAKNGGGAYYGTLYNCLLTGNSAYSGGGGASGATLNACTLTGNSSTFSGGGAYRGRLNNCMLSGNSALEGGGASEGVLTNCTLQVNRASNTGGGACESTLNNCTLTGNSATSDGGGSCDGTLNNCTLSGNSASFYGGGSDGGTLNNCTLSGNSASSGGGSYGGTLNNCTLAGNSAFFYGGGAYFGTLNSCTLLGNSASNEGGGSCYATLNNCTLTGNWALNAGGGSSYDTLNNCTLSGNSASDGSGSCHGKLNNCIVWGNTLASGVTNNYYASTFSYCCTMPLPSGTGNICHDPLFKDSLTSNFMPQAGSPCVNTGNNASVVGTTDFAGNPRILAGRVDMGAYEMTQLAVTLDWQNGGDVTLTNVLYGQAYQLPPAVFADATFLGWWTLPNAMGTSILPETLVSVASNHMLYAKWDVNSVVGSTGLVWQTAGDSLWFVQTNAVTQGLSAMRSGVISDDQTSWIGTSVTGPGQFSFWWRVSSEGGYDKLAFAVDGVENRVISGMKKAEWQVVEVQFTTAGAHELRWTYSKDDSVSEGLDCGWLDRVAWIPSRPIIPGNPNVSSNFLDNVTQAQVDALVAGLRAAHPDVTDGEIAKKFEDAELFGFTGAALVGVGTDALVRFNPSITLATLSVSEGDPRTLVVTLTMGNNIDPTPAEALSRIGEAINSRMRGIFRNSLSSGASETILAPALSLDNATGVVTATFTLENPFTTTGFLRMSLSR